MREILNLDSHSWTESYDGDEIEDDEYKINENSNVITKIDEMRNAPSVHYSPGLVHKRRPKVGEVLRNKQRLQSRRFYGTTGSTKPENNNNAINHLSIYDNMSVENSSEGKISPPDSKTIPKKKFLSMNKIRLTDSNDAKESNAGMRLTFLLTVINSRIVPNSVMKL